MAKSPWSTRLKKWRRDKQEEYAKAILSPPVSTTLYSVMPYPGIALVMGARREGKTGVAHEIAHQYHSRRKLPAVLHLPFAPDNVRKRIQKLIPPWMKVVTHLSEWPKNCVVICDEAAQSGHARRTQSGQAVQLDNLVGVSGQRNQMIIFVSHHSRKLDLNIVHEVDLILWKRPTYAHQMFEREELSDFTMRAYDFFQSIKGLKARKQATLAMDFHQLRFLKFNNKLPPWWSDELSRLFQNIQAGGKGVL